MQFLVSLLVKVVLSILLFAVLFVISLELCRIWSGPRITLADFAYGADGTSNDTKGKAFSQRLYQQLQILQKLLEAAPAAPVPGCNDKSAHADKPSEGQNSLIPLPIIPPLATHLNIPEFDKVPLSGIELKVQGIDLGSLARSLYQFAAPPDEFLGSVAEVDHRYSTLVEWRRTRIDAASVSRLTANDHASLEDALIATACNVVYLLILDENKKFDQNLTRDEFEIFARGMLKYASYREAILEMRLKSDSPELRAKLDAADAFAVGLVDRGAGGRFSPVYLFAAITAAAKNEIPRARNYLALYKEKNPKDKSIDDLDRRLNPPGPPAPKAAPETAGNDPKTKFRPVRPGVSAASTNAAVGTICCVVRDTTDKFGKKQTYLLSTEPVFAGPVNTPVVQPSALDGGQAASDVVAVVARSIDVTKSKVNTAAGTLAAVAPGMDPDPNCLLIGAFEGIDENVAIDDKVQMVGRGSGLATGKVVGLGAIQNLAPNTLLAGLIVCEGENGKPMATVGDSGAPVCKGKKLIGMAYTAGDRYLYVVPIKGLFDQLNVELVTAR